MEQPRRIIISRTDSIGDVVLTLPMAAAIKKELPHAEVYFLGNSYTKNIIEACTFVDVFLNWDDMKNTNVAKTLSSIQATDIIHVFPHARLASEAKKAGIKNRIGTTHRLYHWYTCNTRIALSRKRSALHEAQLNLKLLQGLHIKSDYTLHEIQQMYGLAIDEKKSSNTTQKKKIILHPKSRGSAREWGLQNFRELIRMMDPALFDIYISGTKEEEAFATELTKGFDHVNNICGKMSLNEFIQFIGTCDALIACSTGPLHIASAKGIKAIGLYAPMKPIFPQRWAPIGTHSSYLVIDKDCNACKSGGSCACILQIQPKQVLDELMK
jgi:ADP-heptose:LPS heptosyltransferase